MDASRGEMSVIPSISTPHDDQEDGLILEDSRMDSEMMVSGAIVDSWTERADTRLVLQVAPCGRPRELMIVEAETSLIPDIDWLDDLRENLCHGSPVSAVGRSTTQGLLRATRLQLVR